MAHLVFETKQVRNLTEFPLLFRSFIILLRLRSLVLCVKFVAEPGYVFVTNFKILLLYFSNKDLGIKQGIRRERIPDSVEIGHKNDRQRWPYRFKILHWYLQRRYLLMYYLSRILIKKAWHSYTPIPL